MVVKLILIFSAGGVGAVLRYGVGIAAGGLTARSRAGEPGDAQAPATDLGNEAALALFPFGTLAVNILGCVAIGALIPLLTGVREEVRLALVVGLLGGFTTFSAFGHETVSLIEQGRAGLAAAYAGASVAGGIGAVVVGRALAGALGG